MQRKTSSKQFQKYGSVYTTPMDVEKMEMTAIDFSVNAKRYISQMYCFDCVVYLEMQSGMASLLICEEADAELVECFAVHRLVKINPGLCFAMVSVTPNISYRLIVDNDYNYTMETMKPPYEFNRILPNIRINEILGFYYNVRTTGYHFEGETHNYFELTYVDRGTMVTKVDDKEFILKENDLLIYGPGQFHTQEIPEGESCSYVTIIFDMKTDLYDETGVSNQDPRLTGLLNKVFGYNKKVQTLIKDFISESNSQIPYMNSLMLCLLQETMIRLLQYEFTKEPDAHPVTEMRQHYQDELLNKILNYIDETITEPITVAEICQKFSLSRSSLQILFKENIQQTPKKYISDLKLDKSCQLIRENRYTISEIALMLGFNSIHYFSRAFTQKYNIAPSEYAKQMFNQ